jgi:hypothetical protein
LDVTAVSLHSPRNSRLVMPHESKTLGGCCLPQSALRTNRANAAIRTLQLFFVGH